MMNAATITIPNGQKVHLPTPRLLLLSMTRCKNSSWKARKASLVRAQVYFPSIYDPDLGRTPWRVVRAPQYVEGHAIQLQVDPRHNYKLTHKLETVGVHPAHIGVSTPSSEPDRVDWHFPEVPGQQRMTPNVPYVITKCNSQDLTPTDGSPLNRPRVDPTAATPVSSDASHSPKSQSPPASSVSTHRSLPLLSLQENSETAAYWMNEEGIGRLPEEA